MNKDLDTGKKDTGKKRQRKVGGMKGWRDGGMEGWKNGGMEGWRGRALRCISL